MSTVIPLTDTCSYAGGIAAWNTLSPVEQAERDKALIAEVVETLGKTEYNELADTDKHCIDLFWAGCCMHKDQNSFLGGSKEMMSEWERLGATLPVLLANKFNSATLKCLLEPGAKVPDTLTEEEHKVFDNLTCSSIKLCTIAGPILNNKDDKKG
ncbi:hypothetical protein DFH08DRAFT_974444 [Mycena albidolilacea]|uniref:Uncharacterized protein n=1 Tax=Mycena albidolilacea TaxID=1033008 RepID=A0AAD6Z6T7_9AGAR|nr:hypothetical protein DFH08DRAFT_974444 [Mycena albidolilacea]